MYFTGKNKYQKTEQKAIAEAGGKLTLQLKLNGGKCKTFEEISHIKKFRWCGVILTRCHLYKEPWGAANLEAAYEEPHGSSSGFRGEADLMEKNG